MSRHDPPLLIASLVGYGKRREDDRRAEARAENGKSTDHDLQLDGPLVSRRGRSGLSRADFECHWNVIHRRERKPLRHLLFLNLLSHASIWLADYEGIKKRERERKVWPCTKAEERKWPFRLDSPLFRLRPRPRVYCSVHKGFIQHHFFRFQPIAKKKSNSGPFGMNRGWKCLSRKTTSKALPKDWSTTYWASTINTWPVIGGRYGHGWKWRVFISFSRE